VNIRRTHQQEARARGRETRRTGDSIELKPFAKMMATNQAEESTPRKEEKERSRRGRKVVGRMRKKERSLREVTER
jgi:hypothetical protein